LPDYSQIRGSPSQAAQLPQWTLFTRTSRVPVIEYACRGETRFGL